MTYRPNVFIADRLRNVVTMTFETLTLNVFSISAVMWSNSLPNFSDIEQKPRPSYMYIH